MKSMFPGYDAVSDVQRDICWREGIFVFDTNVLLNLYRYRLSTRQQLLESLRRIGGRIWIPYYVALEFQINRVRVIAETNKQLKADTKEIRERYSSLKNLLERQQKNTKWSFIKPETLIEQLNTASVEFESQVEKINAEQQEITEPDELKAKIDVLFDGHVGDPPHDQTELDSIYREGARRFECQIPPGYQDDAKGKERTSEFIHRGLIYKRQYGDYLLWYQLLMHSRDNHIDKLIFVTDDRKEDWWRQIDFDGPKIIGPRPELIEEFLCDRADGIFLMYRPETFLTHAGDFFRMQVSSDAVEEVRELSLFNKEQDSYMEFRRQAEIAVKSWLLTQYDHVSERAGFPHFVVDTKEKMLGVAIEAIRRSESYTGLLRRVREDSTRGYYEVKSGNLNSIMLVMVIPDLSESKELVVTLRGFQQFSEFSAEGREMDIAIGVIGENGMFSPYMTIRKDTVE